MNAHAKGNEETLIRYWTEGEGAAKIRWGQPHDFDRCVDLVTTEAHGKVPDVKGYCANLHKRALGVWPGQEDKKSSAVRAADGKAAPPLVTLAGVDLVATGQWGLSTGESTFTTDDLAAAVAASQCPAVGPPVIKLGHVDPRFDGEPAVGRITNMTLTAGGNKITGDLTGLPGWLGDVIASAYPNRSIEGSYGFTCQIGHLHPFVITALALLGVASPGVGVLNSLDDVGALFGVSAATDPGHPWKLTIPGGPMASNPVLAAGLTTEDVRRAYYDQPNISYAMWITELQLSPLQLIVADEATSQVFRVPVTATGGKLTFGDPVPVAVEYVDVPRRAETAASLRYATKEESRAGLAAAWDGGAAEKNLGDEPPADKLRKLYALPAASKSDSKLPHHEVSGDGTVGEPNAAACSAAIGALNGGRGGMKGVSPAQAKAAYTHLAGHLTSMGQEPPPFTGPGSAASARAAVARVREIRAAAAGVQAADTGGASQTVQQLVAALDATLDQVDALIPADTSDLPDPVNEAFKLIASAEQISDELMSLLNIPDPDSTGGGDQNASRRISAMHGATSATHSHPHPAFGAQGEDMTHEHQHTHSGDATHDHAHASAGATRKGASEVEFTEEQNSALRAHLALGETGDLTPEVLLTAVEALRGRADAKIAAGAKHLPEGVIAIEREAWDELNRRVAAGEAFRRKQAVAERDTVIAAAIEQGKFTPARRQHWVRLWDADPEGTRIVLAGLQRNVVPLEDIGSAGGGMADELLDDEYKRLFPPGAIRDTTG